MAVSSKLVADLDAGSATTSGSPARVTTLPDALGGSSATDPVGSNGPTLGTSNGNTIMQFSGSQHLSWPLQSASNAKTDLVGFAFWIRPSTVTPASGYHEPFACWNDSTARRLNITQHNSDLEIYVGSGNPTASKTVASQFAANTWIFLYLWFDGSQAAGSRIRVWKCVPTTGAVTELTLTAAVGTTPTTIPSATGNVLIGAYDTSDTDALSGDFGRHIYVTNALLTTSEILELAAIHSPTELPIANGTPTAPSPTATGTVLNILASGAPTAPHPTATGTVLGNASASGAATAPSPTATGTPAVVVSASGAPAAPSPTATGTASPVVASSGAPTAPSPSATGTASPVVAASGARTLPSPTATGAASVVVAPSGAPSLPSPTASGAASPEVAGSGAATAPSPTATGTPAVVVSASGAGTLSAPTATGSARPIPPTAATVTPYAAMRERVQSTITQQTVVLSAAAPHTSLTTSIDEG